MLNSLICALSGGYVNFGVFSLYNDKVSVLILYVYATIMYIHFDVCILTIYYNTYTLPSRIQALQNALDVSLQLCLQIPLADIIAYVKLSKAYFGFLEVLFRNHLDVLSGLDSPIFLQLVKSNHEGLQSAGKLYIVCCFPLNFPLIFVLFCSYFLLL